MPQERNKAKPAQVEDYDEDNSQVVPETVVQASQSGRRSSSSRASKPTERPSRRDAASDSGYSSHVSATPAPLVGKSGRAPAPAPTTTLPPTTTTTTAKSPAKSRPPLIHRVYSGRASAQKTSPTKASSKCSDANCRDPNCSERTSSRRHTFYYPSSSQQPQQYTSTQYPYVPTPITAQMMPSQTTTMGPPPRPRPRSGSNSRQRPLSMNGYAFDNSRPGPPPSASAWHRYPYPQYETTPQPQAYGYPPPSPISQSPTSPPPTYPGYPGFPTQISARQPNPNFPGLENYASVPAPGLSRTFSARQADEHAAKRRSYREPDPRYSSDSESDYSSDEVDAREPRRESYIDSRTQERRSAFVEPLRRPSVSKKSYTEPSLPTRSRKEQLPQEHHRRDLRYESDVNDSDRTQRAVIADIADRRRSTISSSSHSSRRPSTSTAGSSGRTKASSMTDYDGISVESANGGRKIYTQAELIRRYNQQKLDDIAAYQRDQAGGEPYDLTAERIKAQNRKSGSHTQSRVSRGKNSTHSSKNSRSDGIQIRTGGTVVHIHGDTNVEMRQTEDGAIVIASTSARDSAYQGSSNSKSSGSRMGRSRSVRKPRVINEEADGYEQPLRR